MIVLKMLDSMKEKLEQRLEYGALIDAEIQKIEEFCKKYRVPTCFIYLEGCNYIYISESGIKIHKSGNLQKFSHLDLHEKIIHYKYIVKLIEKMNEMIKKEEFIL